ncbi:hypothetical protein CAC42_2593 [Sphaceloma murrayae]|uniref:Uncharacterized protein n=1 Tax=Sphaceloma murrayae TaxID=2082308 RepID=A0A2K1QWI2_9PEZI|nr:hypothetical protein CAC42_2593 [Sphaceloma murrayae]
MFKRRAAQPQQEQKRQIGQPQLLHTTYDQNNLVPKITGLTASNAPSEYFRTPVDDLPSSLFKYRRLDASLETGHVFHPGHRRDVSSVYSRPSHEAPSDTPHYMSSQQAEPSPSTYPAMSATLTQPYSELPTIGSPDSLGSATPTQTEPSGRKNYFASHIPQLRKQKSQERRKSPSSEPATKWDEYRGEPVRDGSRGKPGSVRPNTFEQSLRNDQRYNVTISGGSDDKVDKARKPTWGERAARIRKDTFDARPPWKGGAGRTAIVDPVKDTPVPRSSPKFTAVRDMSKPGLEESGSDNSMTGKPTRPEEPRNMSPVSQLGGRYEDDVVVARNDSTQGWQEKDVSPITTTPKSYFSDQQQPRGPPVRMVPQNTSSPTPSKVSRKPVGPRVMDKENRSPQSHSSSNEWSNMGSANRSTPGELQGDPVSRFSWTTVNTTTTYQQDSPPPSLPPVPVPSLDRNAWRNISTGPAVPSKPPTPPPHSPENRKNLPPAPVVSKTMTHVEMLATQDNELALRRRNIQRIIQELQQVDNASPLDVDWKTVKANKKKLEERRGELSEIEREQHELGLAIARARRRAEREEGYESGLWVRKVTG